MNQLSYRAFVDELSKIASIPPKLLFNPKFEPYFERIAKGGKEAPRLFKGGPPVRIPGISPAKPKPKTMPQVWT